MALFIGLFLYCNKIISKKTAKEMLGLRLDKERKSSHLLFFFT